MQIDDSLLLRLQDLAKLRLSENEKKIIKKDLEGIFEMFEKLKELDTKNVVPFSHFEDQEHHYREDLIGTHLEISDVLDNSPATKDVYFIVPKMIK